MKKIASILHMHRIGKDKAFTLFVALLVASLLLSIGFSIGNILIKQLVLTQTGSGTQVAFYAADSATECALFWDRKDAGGISIVESPFGTRTVLDPSTPVYQRLLCGSGIGGTGEVLGISKVCDPTCGPTATMATTNFFVSYIDPNDPKYTSCAHVKIVKNFDSNTGLENTTIETRGYNTNVITSQTTGGYGGSVITTAQCNLERSRVVERGLSLTY